MAKKMRALSALPLTPAFVVVLAACGGGTPEPQPPMMVANPPATHEGTPDNPPRLGDEHVGPKPEPSTPPVPTAAPDVKPPSMDTNPPQPQPSATGTAKPAPTAKPKGKTPKPG